MKVFMMLQEYVAVVGKGFIWDWVKKKNHWES